MKTEKLVTLSRSSKSSFPFKLLTNGWIFSWYLFQGDLLSHCNCIERKKSFFSSINRKRWIIELVWKHLFLSCFKASCKVISLARKVPISWLPIYIQWLVQGFNRREKINAPSPTHLTTIGSIYINLSICPAIDQYSHFICVCSYSFPNLIVLRFEYLNSPCLKLLTIVFSKTKFQR